MASFHPYQDIYLNELAVDRTRSFRHISPWTPNFSPIISAMVFIALSTLFVFFMQARSLTRKMRPIVSGVPTRLPATIVWGLFSLQRSHLSHVQAETVQVHGLVSIRLGCNSSQFFWGVPSNVFQSILDIPDEFVSYNGNKHQLSSVSQSFSQVDEFQTPQQIRVPNDVKSRGKPTKDEQAVDLKHPQENITADPSGQRFLNGQMLLTLCDAKKSKGAPDLQFVARICSAGKADQIRDIEFKLDLRDHK